MGGPRGPVINRSQFQNPTMDWLLGALRDIFKPYGEPAPPPAAPAPDFTRLAGQLTPQDVGGMVADPRNAQVDPIAKFGVDYLNVMDRLTGLPERAIQNAPADLAANVQGLGQLALNPGMLSDMVAKGVVGGFAKTLNLTPAGEQALLPEGVREAMAVPEGIGDYYQGAYGSLDRVLSSLEKHPISSLLDAWDLSDLTPGVIGAMAAGRRLVPPTLFPGIPETAKAATEWAGLPGFYSRAYEAAGQLRPELKVNQVINALYELGAPPEEIAAVGLKDRLANLQATLPAGQNAKVTREQVAALIKEGTQPFLRYQEITNVPNKPDIEVRRVLQRRHMNPARPPSPGNPVWTEIRDELSAQVRQLRQGTSSWDRTPAQNREIQRLETALSSINELTNESIEPVRSLPGGRFGDNAFQLYFPGGEDFPLPDYGTSAFGLPPAQRSLRDEGFTIGKRSSAYQGPYFQGADEWVVYGPDGSEHATYNMSEAPTMAEAELLFLNDSGGLERGFETGHYNTNVRPNIFHYRTARVPEHNAVLGYELQADAFNQGRERGFVEHPQVPGNLVQVVVREGDTPIPLEPMTPDEATLLAERLKAEGRTVDVQPYLQPAPKVEAAQLSTQLDDVRTQLAEIRSRRRPGTGATTEDRVQELILQAQLEELQKRGGPPLHGGMDRVGPYRRPPFSNSTAEDMMLKLLVMDAAQNNLSGVMIPAGRSHDLIYGHGDAFKELSYGPTGNPAHYRPLIENVGSLQEAQALVQRLQPHYPGVTYTYTPEAGFQIIDPNWQLGREQPLKYASTGNYEVSPPDLETLAGPVAGRALTDPKYISRRPSMEPIGRSEITPERLQQWKDTAERYYGDDAESVQRYIEDEQRYFLDNEEQRMRDLLWFRGERLSPGESLTRQEPTPGVFVWTRTWQPPEMPALIQAAMQERGLPFEQALQEVLARYDTGPYLDLRGQFERMGLPDEQARALTERPNAILEGDKVRDVDPDAWRAEQQAKLTKAETGLQRQKDLPRRYDELKQKFLAQGLPEAEATKRANKAFNVGPEGLQVGDLSKAQAELDDLRRAVESDLAQMEWGQGEAGNVAQNLDLLKTLPRKITTDTVNPGWGESLKGTPAFFVGDSVHHPGWKLTRNYNERILPKAQALIDKWLPGATLDDAIASVDTRFQKMTEPGGQLGKMITLPEPLRKKLLAPRSEGGGLPLYLLLPFLMEWEQEDLDGQGGGA